MIFNTHGVWGRYMFRDIVGRLLLGIGPLVFWIGGIWTIFATYNWLVSKIGSFWAFVGLMVFGPAIPLIDIAAGVIDGNWSLFALSASTIVLTLAASGLGIMILARTQR